MPEAQQKSPFPAPARAKFPRLQVYAQVSKDTTKEGVEQFLRDHGMEPEYVGISTTSADPDRPNEGVLIIKIKGSESHAIIPFGMILAVAEDKPDYLVIHPQVFLTFYDVVLPAPAPASDEPIDTQAEVK